MTRTYTETFDEGPAGWWGWESNALGPRRLQWQAGVLTSRSPWWVDYNHAPPGLGYLHILYASYTRGALSEAFLDAGGRSRLIDDGYPLDYRGARVTLRCRGEVEWRGAQLLFLVQASIDGLTSGWVCTGRPFEIGAGDWSEPSVVLDPDPALWRCLGSRHDRTETYGERPLERVLGEVNCDILFILHPLCVEPMGPIDGAPHHLRPERDYPIWRSRLPEGYVELDTVEIDFAVA